jgi:hypothetical protein
VIKLPADYPDHVKTFVSNVEEVGKLREIHTELTGRGPGRRHVEVLNKSGIVLMIACWEAYVEDLAVAAFDSLMSRATDHKVIPANVLVSAAKPLRVDPNESKVWELAGDGWKAVVKRHRVEVLERYVGKLNTPKPGNVDELFKKLVGLDLLSSCWGWKGTSVASARSRLERLVELRGQIAHRVKATSSVKKQHVWNCSEFLCRLAACSSNHVRQHLHSRTSAFPWRSVGYRGTK